MCKIYGRPFGFELEFSTPIDKLADIMRKIVPPGQLKIKPNMCNKYRHWQIVHDYTTESELVSPILKYSDMPDIQRIIGKLKKSSLKITKKDSFHLHVYAGDVPEDNIIIAWLSIEHIIKKCFPRHRRKSEWAESLMEHYSKNKKIADFFADAVLKSKDHSVILSLQHYRGRNRHTVEFRLFEGTIDFENIENWIKFCMIFLNYAKKIKVVDKIISNSEKLKDLDDLIKEMKLSKYPKVMKWLEKRLKKYK
jgi:hypothetical protein